MENTQSSICSAGSAFRATRTIRNACESTSQKPTLLQARKDPAFHDFILLAAKIRSTDLHEAGHRANIILQGGSFLAGQGSSFTVYLLSTAYRRATPAVATTLAMWRSNPLELPFMSIRIVRVSEASFVMRISSCKSFPTLL